MFLNASRFYVSFIFLQSCVSAMNKSNSLKDGAGGGSLSEIELESGGVGVDKAMMEMEPKHLPLGVSVQHLSKVG